MKIVSSFINETLEIGSGSKTINVPVKINIAQMAGQLMHERIALSKIGQSKNPEEVGVAVTRLFNAVFGEENTSKIVEFYSNDYVAMMVDLTPFITEIVFPAIDQYRQRAVNAVKKVKHG